MSLREYLKELKIDQIEDDTEFCDKEYNAIMDYCTERKFLITDADLACIVMPLNKIEDLLYRCNLKLKKGKNLEDVRMCVGRGFKSTFGNMELARHKIADEIDKVCVIARWDFAVAKYKSK